MSHTRNRWTQDTPQPDGQVFISADKFADIGALTAVAFPGPGLLQRTIAASLATKLVYPIAEIFRTGVLATPNLTQRQFGTAASQPGPSAVYGTSGPDAYNGFPPFTAAQMPTLGGAGNQVGKGLQINWIDVIYSVAAVNLTAATLALSQTIYQNATAPAVISLIGLGNNGLPLAFAATPYRTRVTPANPANIRMLTADGAEITLDINLTTPAGGTAIFYGAILGVSFNYN